MLEYYGVLGIKPGPHTWREYERIYLGFRRNQETNTAMLISAVAHFLGGRSEPWRWSSLVPRVENEDQATEEISTEQFSAAMRKEFGKGNG